MKSISDLKLSKPSLALVLALSILPQGAMAEKHGPSEPDPIYPECTRYPVIGSKGDILYWKYEGICERAQRAASDPNERWRG